MAVRILHQIYIIFAIPFQQGKRNKSDGAYIIFHNLSFPVKIYLHKISDAAERQTHVKILLLLQVFLCRLIDQGVHPFFLFPTNILSSKVKQVSYKIILINGLFIIIYIIYIYKAIKWIYIVGNLKKKCGQHEKVGEKLVKAATFLTGLPLYSWVQFILGINVLKIFDLNSIIWHYCFLY